MTPSPGTTRQLDASRIAASRSLFPIPQSPLDSKRIAHLADKVGKRMPHSAASKRESLIQKRDTPLATPTGVDRMSIALYYYTNTWNPSVQEHSTLYHISRNNKVRLRLDRVLRTFVQDLIPPIFRKAFRSQPPRSETPVLSDG